MVSAAIPFIEASSPWISSHRRLVPNPIKDRFDGNTSADGNCYGRNYCRQWRCNKACSHSSAC